MHLPLLPLLASVTAGLLLTLCLRRLARHLFGATSAFTLWLCPLLLGAVVWLPAWPEEMAWIPPVVVQPALAALSIHGGSAPTTFHWLIALWIAGSGAMLLRLVVHYLQLRRQTQTLPMAMHDALRDYLGGLAHRRLRLHPTGPSVLWAPRCLLLLPPDFLQRHDDAERALVLQHELAHLFRGDAWWSLLAELVFALLWFHPLAWFALPRFRLDQELACDEVVLRASPTSRVRYAQTLLHSIGIDGMPVITPWLAEPQLKERLVMIQRPYPGFVRRRAGHLLLLALMVTSAMCVQAASPAAASKPASADMAYNIGHQPPYPADAIKNKEEGMVMLEVLVGTDGKALKVRNLPKANTTHSASLIQAAIDTAQGWRFIPAEKNGKPVQGWARVPVQFNLAPMHDGEVSTKS